MFPKSKGRLFGLNEIVMGVSGEQERSPDWRVLGEALSLTSGIEGRRDSPLHRWVQGERSLPARD